MEDAPLLCTWRSQSPRGSKPPPSSSNWESTCGVFNTDVQQGKVLFAAAIRSVSQRLANNVNFLTAATCSRVSYWLFNICQGPPPMDPPVNTNLACCMAERAVRLNMVTTCIKYSHLKYTWQFFNDRLKNKWICAKGQECECWMPFYNNETQYSNNKTPCSWCKVITEPA